MARRDPFEPISQAVHLCIDMQNIFASGGLWATPWMERVLPGIVRLVEHNPARTIFSRFVTPRVAEERPGQWRRYFTRWSRATQAEIEPSALEVVAALAKFIPPAIVIDKPAYSAFFNSGLSLFLARKEVATLIITGSETDVCVLSSVLDGVDYGYRVIVLEDGLCSSSDEGHDALMTLYRTRFTEQIELLTLNEVCALWRDPA